MKMRRITMGVFALVAASALTSGCCARDWTWITDPHRSNEPLTQNCKDHKEYVNRIADHNSRAINDDLDLIFMTDRPTRLTRWQER